LAEVKDKGHRFERLWNLIALEILTLAVKCRPPDKSDAREDAWTVV